MQKIKTLDSLIEILEKNKDRAYPVLGSLFTKDNFCEISLSVTNPSDADGLPEWKGYDVATYKGLEKYVKNVLTTKNAKVAHGGYGEHRAIYTSSEHFNSKVEDRCIHLGIDLWADAGTPVFAPLDGTIHSFRYNNQILDYGATIITQHELVGIPFYLLFGHLSLKSLQNRFKNEKILRGSPFAWLGNQHENGGWLPHLHLQLITDLMGWEGDFPGVATKVESPQLLEICPSPEVFCGY